MNKKDNTISVLHPKYGDITYDISTEGAKMWDGSQWQSLGPSNQKISKFEELHKYIKGFLEMKGISINEFEEYITSIEVADKLSKND